MGKFLGFKISKSKGREEKQRQKKAHRRKKEKPGNMNNPHPFGKFSWPILPFRLWNIEIVDQKLPTNWGLPRTNPKKVRRNNGNIICFPDKPVILENPVSQTLNLLGQLLWWSVDYFLTEDAWRKIPCHLSLHFCPTSLSLFLVLLYKRSKTRKRGPLSTTQQRRNKEK